MSSPDAFVNARSRVTTQRGTLARVLNHLRTRRVATRQEIEDQTGLGRAVVADRVTTLIRRGLVVEGPPGAWTGGRVPATVSLNASAGCILVGSLGTTTLGVGLADVNGELLTEHHEPADATLGAEAILVRIAELFDWLIEEHPTSGEPWAVSLALPGLVGPSGGHVGARPTLRQVPGWIDYPIVDFLSRYGAPVLIDSEVHLMALGELRVGHGSGRQDLLFVKVGTGISAGLCSDGRVQRGANGCAGDIGHVAVADDRQTICRCGNSGCLEALAGGNAIAQDGLRAAQEGRSAYLAKRLDSEGEVSAAHVGMGAMIGDPACVELISRSGRLIGETLATLITGFDPSLVVIGGGVAQAGPVLLAAVRDGIYRRSRSLATDNLTLLRSELGKTAGLIGGAQAALEDLFAEEYLMGWIDDGSPRTQARDTRARPRRQRRGAASPRVAGIR